jgi:hypothetical protein
MLLNPFHDNIAKCHKCNRRQADCAGKCVCTIDGISISDHARKGSCALGKFTEAATIIEPTPASRLGDRVEKLLARFGADHLKRLYTEVTGKPCGCNARKAWLNAFGEANWLTRAKMLRALLAAKA